MNQKKKTPLTKSGYRKKSARPEHLQKEIMQERVQSRKRKRFGIILFVLLLVLSGSMVLLSGIKTDNRKVKEVSSAKIKNTKEEKETRDLVEMEESREIHFEPHCIESTKPENLISYTNVEVDGNVLENVEDYTTDRDISFKVGQDYTDVDGIVTFRGNSFRDNPTYGYANMTMFKLNKLWSADTGSLSSGSAVWTGSGWTGQPLMMKWPKEVKAHMNMTEKARADDELVEVIYACMDGYIYFLDLKTGEKTRDPLYLGYTFKGAGALDPRGYPIMYVLEIMMSFHCAAV